MHNAKILGKKLLFAFAHPDDESFCSAGTIYKNYKSGGKSFIICATCGEKGKAHLKQPLSEMQLKKIRKKELINVSKFLKVQRLLVCSFPDTKLKFFALELRRKILAVTKKEKPDFIISFGKNGLSGHLDHIAIGEAARQVAKQLKIQFISVGIPPILSKNYELFKRRRKFGVYSKKVKLPKPNLKISIDPKIKMRALKFHKSQFYKGETFINIPGEAIAHNLKYEYYVM
jgi:LmbE family N-acetylglucosaminyl deacetylase